MIYKFVTWLTTLAIAFLAGAIAERSGFFEYEKNKSTKED